VAERTLELFRVGSDSVSSADSADQHVVSGGYSASDSVSFTDVATRAIVASRDTSDDVATTDSASGGPPPKPFIGLGGHVPGPPQPPVAREVSIDLDIIYRVLAPVDAEVVAAWRTRNRTVVPMAIGWRTRRRTRVEVRSSWKTRRYASADLGVKYGVDPDYNSAILLAELDEDLVEIG